MMEERLGEFLTAVRRYDTFTAVAQSLFVSQPYVSRQIGAAEKKYQVQLVDRATTPIRLTYAGERLLAYLQREQQVQRNLMAEMNRLGNYAAGSISIGINQPLGASWLPRLLELFYEKFPQVHLTVAEVTTSKAASMLVDGQLDMFIGKRFYDERVATQKLGTLPLALLVPKNSPLYHTGPIVRPLTDEMMNALNGEPFIGIGNESTFQEAVDHALQDNGIRVNKRIEASDSRIAINLAASGLGTTITSPNALSRLPENAKVNVLVFPEAMLSLELCVAHRQDDVLPEPLRVLLQLVLTNADTLLALPLI
ncbi:LysR family transcriptional regulator [Furfurilactobacillus siliginis]|nr:LysR family transcriptional regulator [Furfurilactobacillus siliginis]